MRFNIRTTKKAKSHLRGQPVRIGGETLVEGSVGKSVQGVKATTGGTRHFSDPSCSRFAVVGIAKGFEVIRKKFKNTVKRRKDKHVLENVDSAEREAAADDGMVNNYSGLEDYYTKCELDCSLGNILYYG